MRGAWVEIRDARIGRFGALRRSPCGERGLKSLPRAPAHAHTRRSPCGERGLKSLRITRKCYKNMSLPVRGAWVEISSIGNSELHHIVAPRAGSVG